ncbi:TonB-dependent siderophore receptor [Marinomonas communis]|uniref:Iron complex outermembrane receptor protein n=1 Tax=Marinomonas communis TaxID=28254 RepID=A0A4R6X639_9GAMM|nr:TonB-dependent siderophore receptor [Marinomonas communis]TDR06862.1 iron complex outermembrane receptor protein [Marinomonas communis]
MAKFLPTKIATHIRHNRLAQAGALLLLSSTTAMASDNPQQVTFDLLEVSAETLKVDAPAQEQSVSISSVDQKALEDRKPQKLDEALRYTSGVTSQPYGADNDTDWVKVRGFDAATYLDGSRLFRDGYYTWLLEPYGLEKVEVLKGPASILYGEAPPGGVVNAVQKKPDATADNQLDIEVGSNSQKSIGIDVSGEWSDNQYRLVGAIKDNDGELNGTENTRVYLAPSLLIDLSDDTTLTLLATFLKDDGIPTNPFYPAAGTILDSSLGSIAAGTNLGQPGYDKYERTQISAGYQLDHFLNDTWTLSQNFNVGFNELYLRSSYIFPSSDTTANSIGQGIVFRDGDTTSVSLDSKAVANWQSDTIENTVLLGLDLQHHKTDGVEQDNYSFGSINPYAPVYGNYTPLNMANNNDREISKSQAGLYAQYQGKLNQQWVASVGGRFDAIETDNTSQSKSEDKSRNDSELSLNAGLMYLGDNGLSPYISYSESFNVLTTIDSATGELYKPLIGKQTEVGVKYAPDSFAGYVNVALFDLKQENALVTNPTTYVATQTGEVTSQGLEVESMAELSNDVTLTASYTYTDAQTDETNNQGSKRPALIPEHMASAWLDLEGAALGAEDWNFGTGLRYIGKSKDNPKSSNLTVPAVTLFDVMAAYQINDQWRAQLNINNVTDKEYLSGCDYYCYYGQSRSIMLSTQYRW